MAADARIDFKVNYDTSKAGQNVQSFGKKLKSVAKLAAGAFAVKSVINFANKSIEAYNKQVEAETKLTEIMTTRIGATEEEIKGIKDLASAEQKVGIFGDELILSGQQQLATFANTTDTLEVLTPAMNNLVAQQKGVNAQSGDFVNIANLMGKALQGQTGALTRVGISFTDTQAEILKTGNEMERATVLTEVITDNVGNMNTELAKTDAGKIANVTNKLGDLQEKVGEALIPIKVEFYEMLEKHLIPFLEEEGVPTLEGMIEVFKDLGKEVLDVADYFDIDLVQGIEIAGITLLALSGPGGAVLALGAAFLLVKDDVAALWDEISKGEGLKGWWEGWLDGLNIIAEKIAENLLGLEKIREKTNETNKKTKEFEEEKRKLTIKAYKKPTPEPKPKPLTEYTNPYNTPSLSAFPDLPGPLGQLFKRANGGQVSSERPYLIGERGPELFVPNSAGNITPNHKLSGGSGTNVTNIYPKMQIAGEDIKVVVTELVSNVLSQTRGAS